MKYLKIENNTASFWDGGQYIPLDKLTKEYLWQLATSIMDKDDFEMDEYDENAIKNKAHQIIYHHVYDHLKQIMDNKSNIISRCQACYQEDYDKYKL